MRAAIINSKCSQARQLDESGNYMRIYGNYMYNAAPGIHFKLIRNVLLTDTDSPRACALEIGVENGLEHKEIQAATSLDMYEIKMRGLVERIGRELRKIESFISIRLV